MRLPTIAAAVLLAASTLGILPATTLAQTPTTASVCSNAKDARRARPNYGRRRSSHRDWHRIRESPVEKAPAQS